MPDPVKRVAWPPRLVGVAFEGTRPFGGRAFVSFDSLTVLLGANGAGKTTTLRALESELPSLGSAGRHGDQHEDLGIECTFFVEVTDDQLEVLADDAFSALSSPIAWPFRFPSWPASGTYSPAEPKGDHATGAWLRTVEPHAPAEVSFGEDLRAALLASRLIAVHRRLGGDCALAWCLDHAVAVAVGITQDVANEQGEDSAPVPVAPLGTAERMMLPTAIAVPRDLDEIRRELRKAIVDILVHLRWGERDRWAASRGLQVGSAADRRGTRAWLADPDADTASVEPSARALCALSSRLATELAPPFVADTHSVVIAIEPFPDWDRGGPALSLDLRREPDARFPIRRAADGYKVWLQLALLEAIAILRRYLDVLESLLDAAVVSQDPAGRSRATPEWKTYDAALALLTRFWGANGGSMPIEQFIALRNVGHRLYLIDEPEQHLHPRLQRSATRWLSEAGTAGASQCVVVTHSPHYLRIPGDVAFAYLQRLGTDGRMRTVIRRLTPELLSAADDVASEMGFDRGELINSVSAIVFVEGEADKQFLEAFSGEELHHAGVLLIPIHGAVRAQRKGLVDSEIVLSITAAKLGVLLDNLVADEWIALQTDHDLCRKTARSSKKTELKAMAEILVRAQEVGREIEPLGIPVPDMFDLLDEDLLRERFPSFPGHATARTQWEAADNKQKVNWKTFYRDHYEIEVEPPLFGEIARAMAERGVRPPAVNKLVRELQEVAASA